MGVGCGVLVLDELRAGEARQINTVLLEVLMQGVVVVDRRGLTAVGAMWRAKGYMICMRGKPRAREYYKARTKLVSSKHHSLD